MPSPRPTSRPSRRSTRNGSRSKGQLWNKLDKEAEEFVIQKGVKVLRASKADEAKVAEKMKPIFPEFVKDMKAKGLPGDEALKFCLDYIKTHP